MIIEKLLCNQTRDSTARTYACVWRQFNKFLIKLDIMPVSWEERTTLFIGYLIEKGMQPSTVKSYVSSIKKMLITDKYKWDNKKVLLASLIKACKLKNYRVTARLPIQAGLLELILFEVQQMFGHSGNQQPFLEALYMALFAIAYYRLMRIGR